MEPDRREAYQFLLNAALWHIKVEICQVGRYLWWAVREMRRQWKIALRARHRAYTFHNLAICLARDMKDFKEELFWRDMAWFQKMHPENDRDYRSLFERKLAGEKVDIYAHR